MPTIKLSSYKFLNSIIMELINKVQNFFDDEFWSALFGLIVTMVISVGLQSLVIWLGGMFLDVILFALFIIAIGQAIAFNFSDFFPYKRTSGGGTVSMIYVGLGIVGTYAYIVHQTPLGWTLLAGSLILMLLNWIFLEKIDADITYVGISVGVGLCYCLGTYFAMLLNGLEPVAEIPEIAIISLATLFAWFRPAFD